MQASAWTRSRSCSAGVRLDPAATAYQAMQRQQKEGAVEFYIRQHDGRWKPQLAQVAIESLPLLKRCRNLKTGGHCRSGPRFWAENRCHAGAATVLVDCFRQCKLQIDAAVVRKLKVFVPVSVTSRDSFQQFCSAFDFVAVGTSMVNIKSEKQTPQISWAIHSLMASLDTINYQQAQGSLAAFRHRLLQGAAVISRQPCLHPAVLGHPLAARRILQPWRCCCAAPAHAHAKRIDIRSRPRHSPVSAVAVPSMGSCAGSTAGSAPSRR